MGSAWLTGTGSCALTSVRIKNLDQSGVEKTAHTCSVKWKCVSQAVFINITMNRVNVDVSPVTGFPEPGTRGDFAMQQSESLGRLYG